MQHIMIALLFLMTFTHVNATPLDNQAEEYKDARFSIVLGNAVAGALISNPLGYVVGAMSGIWLSEKVIDGFSQDLTLAALEQKRTENQRLQDQLELTKNDQQELQQLAADSMQLQILFQTGNSMLDADNEKRIQQLSQYLMRQPELNLMLSGHSDPRGDELYNSNLSIDRINSVSEAIISFGVPKERILSKAYGETQSLASEGDYDRYALERRVDIQLIPVDSMNRLAAAF